jgi:hypothetical protein
MWTGNIPDWENFFGPLDVIGTKKLICQAVSCMDMSL